MKETDVEVIIAVSSVIATRSALKSADLGTLGLMLAEARIGRIRMGGRTAG